MNMRLIVAFMACLTSFNAIAAETKPAKPVEPPAPVERPPTPFEPQLLALSELMGELAFISEICPEMNPAQSGIWRDKAHGLTEAEATGPRLKALLAGAFNRGYSRLEVGFKACNPVATAIYDRDLAAVHRISLELSQHYSGN